jgi:hypothetical protein
MPAVIDACVAEAHRLAALLAQPQSEDPALIGMRDELELMERLAARNPGNRAMAAAVQEQRQRIEGRRRVEQPVVDPATYSALQDAHFFNGATPEQQRLLFAAVLRSVVVGERGDPIQPQPRRS